MTPILIARSNSLPGFHSFLAPTPATLPRSGDRWDRISFRQSAQHEHPRHQSPRSRSAPWVSVTTCRNTPKGFNIRATHVVEPRWARWGTELCGDRGRSVRFATLGFDVQHLRRCYWERVLERLAPRLPCPNRTKLGGRGWTEPAKETPVRSTAKRPILIACSNNLSEFHSFLAPNPATLQW